MKFKNNNERKEWIKKKVTKLFNKNRQYMSYDVYPLDDFSVGEIIDEAFE